jgi:RNA polymerase sigma-70 factor (ECF subfamily)
LGADDEVMLAAARAGDERAFAGLVGRYRGELRVHCYRMLGSLDGRARRVLPQYLVAPSDPSVKLPPRTDIAWLQPFPDRLWEPVAPSEAQPDAMVVARETIELAFLAAIQHLPPRQRAVLILRDVLGWTAKQTAELLGGSVASANSALQRARATLREHLPERRLDWRPSAEPSERERAVLRRYMDAMERADLEAVAGLLAEDVRTAMPPWPMWFRGRDAVVAALAASWDPASPDYVGRFRMPPTGANGQPAVAAYVKGRDDSGYGAFAISVARIEDGRILEMTAFHDLGLFPAFRLPTALPPTDR